MAIDALTVFVASDSETEFKEIQDAFLRTARETLRIERFPSLDTGTIGFDDTTWDALVVTATYHGGQILEVIRRFRQISTGAPPIIALVGPLPESAEQALVAGATDVVIDSKAAPLLYVHRVLTLARYHHAQTVSRSFREREELITQACPDGFWDWNIVTDTLTLSERWRDILEKSPDLELPKTLDQWLACIHPEDVDQVRDELMSHLNHETRTFQSEHRLIIPGEEARLVKIHGAAHWNASGRAIRCAGTCRDITEMRRTEQRLRKSAFYDALTGLPNRSIFMDRLGRSIERAKRRGDYLFAILFIDLDRFKIVNDGLGHAVGDELLTRLAKRLKICVRTTDTLSRYGGDEFALLLDEIGDISDALRVVERIQKHLSEPFHIREHEVHMTASIGVCMNTKEYASADQILCDADIAMYRAKSKGANGYEIFDSDIHRLAKKRLRLEAEMRTAIDTGSFVLHYQPIVSIPDMKLTGFEALVRWHHPTEGLVPPSEFIPIAEESNLIIRLDRWVLTEACRQLKEWRDRFPEIPFIRMSVNLSSKHLAATDLTDFILHALADHALSPNHLRVEITESAIMENVENATQITQHLKNLNILIHMDDFGTGYSSLSHLAKLHVNTLKIDGSFVSNMDTRGENFEIVQMIISLAHGLRMEVIAEGVETLDQLQQLKSLGCEYVQGYYLSKPLSSEDTAILLQKGKGETIFL